MPTAVWERTGRRKLVDASGVTLRRIVGDATIGPLGAERSIVSDSQAAWDPLSFAHRLDDGFRCEGSEAGARRLERGMTELSLDDRHGECLI